MEQRQKHCLLNISRRKKSTFYVWQIIYFGFCYKLSSFLTIIDGYYIWLSSDCTIWYNVTNLKDLLSTICLVFYFHAITFTGGHARKFTHNWEVECCTVIIILPSNKTIGTLTSKSHPKGCISNKSGISNYLMYSCQVLDKNVPNINFCQIIHFLLINVT